MEKTNLLVHFPREKWKKILLEMKITILLVLVLSFGASASIYSQNQRVSMQFEDATILEVLNEIKIQTGLRFIYNEDKLDDLQAINLDAGDSSVEEVLNEIFEETDLECRFQDDVIMIVDRMSKTVVKEQEQKKEVKGTVTDDQGIPLPGVSVVIKGTNTGVATNIDGEYALELENENVVLVFSFVGMTPQEIAYTGQTSLNVTFVADSEQMAEVVVTGIQTIEQGRASGSFQIVKEKDLNKIYSKDLRAKLEGTSPGVYVNKDNEITIRGISTISGETSPLIVIDGMPTEMEIKDVNPNDIKQITVLKDAASAAIWGVKSSNGVIVITTNRGSDGETVVKLKSTFSIAQKRDFDQMKYLDTEDFIKQEIRDYEVNWINKPYADYSELGYLYHDYYNIGAYDMEPAIDKFRKVNNWNDIEKYFFQNEMTQQHNISVTAGSDKISNYLSVNFDQDKGALKGNRINRFNILNNFDLNLSEKLKLTANLRIAHVKSDHNGLHPEIEPYEPIVNEDGSYFQTSKIHKKRAELLHDIGLLDEKYSYVRNQQLNDKSSFRKSISSTFSLEYKIIDGLSIASTFNYEYGNSERNDYYVKEHGFTKNFFNSAAHVTVDTNNVPVSFDGEWHLGNRGGVLKRTNTHSEAYILRNKITYTNSFDDWRISALAGTEHSSYTSDYMRNGYIGYDERSLGFTPVNYKDYLDGKLLGSNGEKLREWLLADYLPSFTERLERNVSYFGTVNISKGDLYSIFGSARLDQTNLLVKAAKYRNNPIWSIGGKFNVSNLSGFKAKAIDNLSIKLAHGVSGLMVKDVTPYATSIMERSSHVSGAIYNRLVNPENPEFTWEKTRTYNMGIDFGLFNKLNGSIELYTKKTKDVMYNVSLNPVVGWRNVRKNSANITNSGIDLALNYKILNGKVKWGMGLNYSYNKNKVTSVDFVPTLYNLIRQNPVKGQPINQAWAIRYAGLDENGDPLIKKAGSDEVLHYRELGNFTQDDYAYLGSLDPSSFGSVTSNVSWKGINMSVLVTYKWGHKVRMPSHSDFSKNIPEMYSTKYRWFAGDNNEGKMIPAFPIHTVEQRELRKWAWNFSDYQLDRGDIVRLKSVNVSYDFAKHLKKYNLKQVELTLSGQNLWFWAANKKGYDSDFLNTSRSTGYYGGYTSYSYPYAKTFVATLSLTF